MSLFRTFGAPLCFTSLFVFLSLGLPLGLSLGVAGAEKPKKKESGQKGAKAFKPAPKAPEPRADLRAVSELMGPFKWGMSPEDIHNVLGQQIDKRYGLQVRSTTDVYQQDNLRKRAEEEKQRIKDSFVKFDGQKTGWDVSIIDREFGQKDDESMLVYWESDVQTKKDQRRFFFFVDDKLWKMFIAFNADRFKGKTYDDFKASMETRYGKGAPSPTSDLNFLYWRSPGYFLRAIDLMRFYGNFCVAISDDTIEDTIAARREARNPKVELRNALIESVTEEQGASKPSLDDTNSDIVDRLTK